jgi:hypothetical protein
MEFHAFAVVALEHPLLLDLPLEEAYALAAAALHLAEAALRAPGSVTLPDLPASGASAPSVVAVHARACLPPEQRGTGSSHAAAGDARSIDRIADRRAESPSAADDPPRFR